MEIIDSDVQKDQLKVLPVSIQCSVKTTFFWDFNYLQIQISLTIPLLVFEKRLNST